MQTQEKLTAVFRTIFDRPDMTLQREHSAYDIEGWDSLTNVRLILAIEKEFGIKIRPAEIIRLQNVGDLLDLVEIKKS